MAGTSNGGSYQKNGGNGATYQEIPGSVGHDERRKRARRQWIIGIVVVAMAAIVYGVMHSGRNAEAVVNDKLAKSKTVSFSKTGKLKLFDDLNRFVVEDFDAVSTFASFLPGVAGYFGKPVWAFYVNRGQGISTFGTVSKETPMMEFNAANKAYQLTPYLGFRTFVQGTRRTGESFQIEPFSPVTSRHLDDAENSKDKPKRILYVGTNELEIEEIDGTHGLQTNVKYFVLPESDFGALVRRTTFTNQGTSELTMDVLDGLAKMEPFGGDMDWSLKNMGTTLEGWMGVYHADDKTTMPFYKLSTETGDEAAVKIEVSGHYCLSFVESAKKKADLLPIVFDSSKVFGQDTSLEMPRGLMASSVDDILSKDQYGWAKTSSAFAAATKIALKPGESVTIASVYGKAETIEKVPEIAAKVSDPGFIATKAARARTMINELTAGSETKTANHLFDGTIRQMFLDNGLRGGFPTVMGNVDGGATYDEDEGVKIFHSFSRIHGDLERDYNTFKIESEYFSQGPGNYRDIAQNRRNDVTFYPRLGSYDIQQFLSFIQADGYEPLTVEAVVFRYVDEDKARSVAKKVTNDAKSAEVLGNVLTGGVFRPGQLFTLCEQLDIQFKGGKDDFINKIVAGSEDRAMAVYGGGYWGDHWDYYIDLIEAYLAIYPDKEEALMYDKPLQYFFSTATIKPRSQKYVLTLTYDGESHHVQQLDATYFDDEKVAEQEAFRDQNTGLLGFESYWYRTENKEPFKSSAIAKLFLLGSLKFATRDAYGMGIEYEGGRPGWLDSMNGLPGMVGSGMPETYELKLLLQYVKKVVDKHKRPVVIPAELQEMLLAVAEALDTLDAAGLKEPKRPTLDVPKPLFEYWDTVAAARENYRNDVQFYFSGNTTTLQAQEVSDMVARWLDQIEIGIKRASYFATEGFGDDGTTGIPACFFAFEITDWELNEGHSDKGLPLVNAMAMKVKNFPLFLEGPVRYMKTIQDNPKKMLDMYERVLESGLRDQKLEMYFLSASLEGQTFDMGRQIAFAPGWLENQSIWMHMSYKYYLQLIRGKLYEQFFAEMKGGGMIPFMDPVVYGRSLMECSSFITSSAFPDPSIVGKGFYARLSGATAEYLDIWKLMFIGPKPFFFNDNGEVEMQLVPALPNWLFEDESADSEPTFDEDGNHVVSFKLFSSIDVTYHNPGGGNIFGVNPNSYKVTTKDGVVSVDGPTIPTKTALEIRRTTNVISIDAYF